MSVQREAALKKSVFTPTSAVSRAMRGATRGLLRRLCSCPRAPPPLVYLVAGEPSGDAIGAKLVRALRAVRAGDLRAWRRRDGGGACARCFRWRSSA